MLVLTVENVKAPATVDQVENLNTATREERLNAVRVASRFVVLWGLAGMYFNVVWLAHTLTTETTDSLHTMSVLAGLWHYAASFSVYGYLTMYIFSPREGVNIDISVTFNSLAGVFNALMFVATMCSMHRPDSLDDDLHPALRMMNVFGFCPFIASCYSIVSLARLFAVLSPAETSQFFSLPFSRLSSKAAAPTGMVRKKHRQSCKLRRRS